MTNLATAPQPRPGPCAGRLWLRTRHGGRCVWHAKTPRQRRKKKAADDCSSTASIRGTEL